MEIGMTLLDVVNGVIFVMGAVAAYCISSSNRKTKFIGFLVASLSEPFWLYATLKTGNWGIFLLSLWYLGCNIRGVINHKGNV
jgi:hypothetical protein